MKLCQLGSVEMSKLYELLLREMVASGKELTDYHREELVWRRNIKSRPLRLQLHNRALYLLDVLNGVEKDPRPSPTHLCGYCQYRTDCPAMLLPKVELPPEIEMLAGRYAELNSTKSNAEKEMKNIRQELLDFTGPVFKGRSDNYDLLVSSVASSMTVDSALLKKEYPDIYPMVQKERAGYTKLEVKQLKHVTA